MGQRAHVVAASRRVVEPGAASRAMCLDGLACLALDGFEPDNGIDFAAMPAPEVAPPGYRDAAFPPDQPEFAIASPVRIAPEMFRTAAGQYSSEERRVGKGCGRTWRTWGAP